MGGGSPKPPSLRHGAKYALEWGEDPPKPPSLCQGAKYALEWGEDLPKPPSWCQGSENTFFQTYKNIHFTPHNHQATPWNTSE